MKKTILYIALIVCVSTAFIIYMKNDGLYMIEKAVTSDLQLISKSTEIDFPAETKIESLSIENDIENYFFSHNQYLEARMLVPTKSIDTLFPPIAAPEGPRDYENIEYIIMDEKEDEINFTVWHPITVQKWFRKTQRTVVIHVMNNVVNDYTEVYMCVDKLGWNIYHIR